MLLLLLLLQGFYCISIKVMVPPESASVTDPATGGTLAVPATAIVNVKLACFNLISTPPNAGNLALRTCGGNGEPLCLYPWTGPC